jgi:long-chain acyl-CoA synthetase
MPGSGSIVEAATPEAPVTEVSSVASVHDELIRPGSVFEVVDHPVASGVRIWKNGPQTLCDVLAAVARFDAREFLVLEDQRISYLDFRRAVSALAADFRVRGVERDDRVALVMSNRPEWIVAWFAVAAAGAVCAPVNPASSADDLKHMLELCEARIVVCDAERAGAVLDAVADFAAAPVILAAGTGSGMSGVHRLEDVLGGPQEWGRLPAPLPPAQPNPDDNAMIFFTAGTTGRSKGVLLNHRACAYSVFHSGFRNARRARLEGQSAAPQDPLKAPQAVHLLPIPLFHVSGSLNSILPQMMRGARIVMMRFWAAELALRLIEREGVTYIGGVPIIAEQLLTHASFGKYSHASLQHVVYGGAPCSSTLARRLSEQGIIPTQNFGMTETAGAVLGHLGPEYLRNPESCGIAAPIHEVRVADASGKPAAPGQPGELQVRGPQIMTGYWRDPGLTAEVLKDGWLRTGDIACLDEHGYCRIVDRAKDMIISAGENIFCSEIEKVLAEHPSVREVSALGIPHEVFGEQAVAVVVPAQGEAATEADLRAFARERLSAFKIPAQIVFAHGALPRNDIGKVRKAELRRLFWPV